jgi:hypothetical protein
MSNSDRLNEILGKLPNASDEKHKIDQLLEGTVEITGELIAKDGEEVLLNAADSILHIPVAGIVSIFEASSKPADSCDSIEVTIKLGHNVKIKVVKLVNAAEYAPRIGMKPLIYDVPSQAHSFSVPAEEQNQAYLQWLQQANLADFPQCVQTMTFRLTSIPTGKTTTTQTTTQNADSNTDSTTDYSTDYISDVD